MKIALLVGLVVVCTVPLLLIVYCNAGEPDVMPESLAQYQVEPEGYALIQEPPGIDASVGDLVAPRDHFSRAVLILWWTDISTQVATVGFLCGWTEDYILLVYSSQNAITDLPKGEPLRIPWASVSQAWWLERGIPLEGR